ncbi:TerD family protein [Nocardia sp. NPDC050435]|uniref:TerD family protein n=1 Tax=Nocardia sp. NPDC050435 TaxID=3155040 RepID=UPI0033DB901B
MRIARGGNIALSGGRLQLRISAEASPGLELSVLSLTASGRVRDDSDLVGAARPTSPDAAITVTGTAVDLDPSRTDSAIERIVIATSAAHGTYAGARLHTAVADGATGYELVADGMSTETAVLLAEVYRHRGGWKLRNLGQGYSNGLTGLATDFGITPPQRPIVPPRPAVPPRREAPSTGERPATALAARPAVPPRPVTPVPRPSAPGATSTPAPDRAAELGARIVMGLIGVLGVLFFGWLSLCNYDSIGGSDVDCGGETMTTSHVCVVDGNRKSYEETKAADDRASWVGTIFFGVLALGSAGIGLQAFKAAPPESSRT